MPDDKTIPTATPPVTLTVIGTGDGLVQGAVAKTPPDQPNIVVNIVTPIMAILVRFANFYGAALLGLLIAGMTPAGGKLLYTGDFFQLVTVCASLALPGALVSSIKDILTITKNLENRWPLLTGGV